MNIIGKADKLDFPSLGLYGISCKVDTGAETSSIHCHRVKFVEVDGKEMIRFYLLDPGHPDYEEKELCFGDFYEKEVKSSNGMKELRFVIQSDITIFGEVYQIELTLANRGEMRFPVLIGRRFLAKNKFLVNPAKRHLSYKNKEQK